MKNDLLVVKVLVSIWMKNIYYTKLKWRTKIIHIENENTNIVSN